MKLVKMAILTAAVAGFSQVQAAGKDKIAVFDVQAAVFGTKAAQEQMKALESSSDYAKTVKDAEKLKSELSSLQDDLKKNASTLPADKLQDKQRDFAYKRDALEADMRKLKEQQQNLAKKIMDDYGPRMESIVKDIVDAEGIGLLLTRQAAVLPPEPAFDITPRVTEKLNAIGKK